MPTTIRILAVGAIAGVEPVWRKLVNAVALDAYRIDVAVQVGGLGVDGDRERAWRTLADERLSGGRIALLTEGDEPRVHALAGARQLVMPGAERALDDRSDVAREPFAGIDDPARTVLVGSVDLGPLIDRHRPALAIWGGALGSEPRKTWRGDTLCLDPGSDAGRGGLCGYVADLGERGVRVAQPLRT